jgi:hypothetical protein
LSPQHGRASAAHRFWTLSGVSAKLSPAANVSSTDPNQSRAEVRRMRAG